MSDKAESGTPKEAAHPGKPTVKLNGLFLRKVGMTSVFADTGEFVPVTVLSYDPMTITQTKTDALDGYSALQLAFGKKSARSYPKSLRGHLARAGLTEPRFMLAELRQDVPADAALGATVSIESLVKGEKVVLVGTSKGKGFAGSMKRYGFAGGPASHGSKFHRQPGSSGNRTWPGRVMPGKRFPGHLGDRRVTVRGSSVFAVLPAENVVLIRGPVPGSRGSVVQVLKEVP